MCLYAALNAGKASQDSPPNLGIFMMTSFQLNQINQ